MGRIKGTKKMTPEAFEQLKLLQQAGLSQADIKRITQKSRNTQIMARASDNFEQYIVARRKANAKIKAKAAAPEPVVVDSPMEAPQHTAVQVTQISCTVDGYKVGENSYTTKVFGLGTDSKLYYWNTQKAEPQWSLEK